MLNLMLHGDAPEAFVNVGCKVVGRIKERSDAAPATPRTTRKAGRTIL